MTMQPSVDGRSHKYCSEREQYSQQCGQTAENLHDAERGESCKRATEDTKRENNVSESESGFTQQKQDQQDTSNTVSLLCPFRRLHFATPLSLPHPFSALLFSAAPFAAASRVRCSPCRSHWLSW